jgi:SprT-like family
MDKTDKTAYLPKTYSPMLSRLYEAYNTAYFNGRLPRLKIYFGELPEKRYGHTAICSPSRRASFITVNKLFKTWECMACVTLLHEMCHVSLGPLEDDHGDIFQEEKKRIFLLGAFNDIL